MLEPKMCCGKAENLKSLYLFMDVSMTERVISLISTAAVVISLIFVGFELRQARQLAVADQMNIQWTLHENDYFQYSNGLMTESVWEAKLRAIRGDLFVCKMKNIWNWRIVLVEQGFRDILEALPTSCKF